MTNAQVDAERVACQLGCDLYAEFADRVEAGPLVAGLVHAELERWRDATIQDFVPIFVRRRVRAQLRCLAVTDGRGRTDHDELTESSSVHEVSV
jgi:hypothetical protein